MTVGPADPPDRPAACRWLVPTAADRLLALFATELSTEHLLVARSGGQVVGAAFAEVRPGGLAAVQPPAAADPTAACLLATALVGRLRRAGVVVAQCLTAGPCPPLEAAGFRDTTELVTLIRPAGPVEQPQSGVTLVPAGAGFADLFAATLAGSLDLPELTGSRSAAAELAGHPVGERMVAVAGGRAVGAVLLGPGEVRYLGLVPAARGRGLGDAVLTQVLEQLGGKIHLSCDARNHPALRLYDRHGFRACGRQRVYLWTAGDSPDISPG